MTLAHRILFVAWQNPTTRRIHPVARLLRQEGEPAWEFVYIRGARDAEVSGFYPFPGLPVFDEVYTSDEIPPLFENRLMPKSRPDRGDFLERLGLGRDENEAIPILARSEGRKATDTIEVFGLPSFDENRRVYSFLCFLRGIRYVDGAEERIRALQPGKELVLHHEKDNVADKLAIKAGDGTLQELGWIPQTLVEDVHVLQEKGSTIRASVERVNANPAPVQLRLLVRLEAGEVEGFVPFAGERYQPIPSLATRIQLRPEEFVS